MVPFILQPTAPAVTEGSSVQASEPEQPHADPFESAMNQALAKDSSAHQTPARKAQVPAVPPGPPNHKAAVRTISNDRKACSQAPPDQTPSHNRSIVEDGNGSHSDQSSARPQASAAAQADGGVLAFSDLGVLQALGVTAPIVPASPAAIASTLTPGLSVVDPSANTMSLIGEEGIAINEEGRSQINKSAHASLGLAESSIAGVMTPASAQAAAPDNLDTKGQGPADATRTAPTLVETLAKGEVTTKPLVSSSGSADLQDRSTLATSGPAPPSGLLVPGLSPPANDQGTPSNPPTNPSPLPPSGDLGKEYPSSVGISAAQQETPMKKAQKMPKTAELSQQNLPSAEAVSAGKTEFSMSPIPATGASVDVVPSTSDSRMLSLERTHDLVAMHALRLSPTSNESMRVVIEPGGGTRLSLELRFNNGGVQAQAVLHRGDFEFLNQHWTELQQRLEPRGVQLSALESSTHSTTDQHQPQHSGRQSADEQSTRSAFAEFALDGTMPSTSRSSRPPTKTHAGWETWA